VRQRGDESTLRMGFEEGSRKSRTARRLVQRVAHRVLGPLARIFAHEDHSFEEAREIIIGHSVNERLLLVCFTARGTSIRIFSARQATGRERRDYEDNVGS